MNYWPCRFDCFICPVNLDKWQLYILGYVPGSNNRAIAVAIVVGGPTFNWAIRWPNVQPQISSVVIIFHLCTELALTHVLCPSCETSPCETKPCTDPLAYSAQCANICVARTQLWPQGGENKQTKTKQSKPRKDSPVHTNNHTI